MTASHTDDVRRRASSIRGWGGFSRWARPLALAATCAGALAMACDDTTISGKEAYVKFVSDATVVPPIVDGDVGVDVFCGNATGMTLLVSAQDPYGFQRPLLMQEAPMNGVVTVTFPVIPYEPPDPDVCDCTYPVTFLRASLLTQEGDEVDSATTVILGMSPDWDLLLYGGEDIDEDSEPWDSGDTGYSDDTGDTCTPADTGDTGDTGQGG